MISNPIYGKIKLMFQTTNQLGYQKQQTTTISWLFVSPWRHALKAACRAQRRCGLDALASPGKRPRKKIVERGWMALECDPMGLINIYKYSRSTSSHAKSAKSWIYKLQALEMLGLEKYWKKCNCIPKVSSRNQAMLFRYFFSLY